MSKHFDLETFTLNGHTLRTVVIDGAPWFAIADIAADLSLTRANVIAEQHHLRELIARNEAQIKEIGARTGKIAGALAKVEWRKQRIEAAKMEIKKAEQPENFGYADEEEAA